MLDRKLEEMSASVSSPHSTNSGSANTNSDTSVSGGNVPRDGNSSSSSSSSSENPAMAVDGVQQVGEAGKKDIGADSHPGSMV